MAVALCSTAEAAAADGAASMEVDGAGAQDGQLLDIIRGIVEDSEGDHPVCIRAWYFRAVP